MQWHAIGFKKGVESKSSTFSELLPLACMTCIMLRATANQYRYWAGAHNSLPLSRICQLADTEPKCMSYCSELGFGTEQCGHYRVAMPACFALPGCLMPWSHDGLLATIDSRHGNENRTWQDCTWSTLAAGVTVRQAHKRHSNEAMHTPHLCVIL